MKKIDFLGLGDARETPGAGPGPDHKLLREAASSSLASAVSATSAGTRTPETPGTFLAELRKRMDESGVRTPPPPKKRGFQKGAEKESHRMGSVVQRPNPDEVPELEVRVGEDVTVLNVNSRGNLTWRVYKLVAMASDMCTVSSLDGKQRRVQRRAVKPGGYICALRSLFLVCGKHLEFRSFFSLVSLLGFGSDHTVAHAIFETLDSAATGAVSFQQFLNWAYGIRAIADNGKLLTVMECVCGVRGWDSSLRFNVMIFTQDRHNAEDVVAEWVSAAMCEQSKSKGDWVTLKADGRSNTFSVPRNLKQLARAFSAQRSESKQLVAEYRPYSKDASQLNVVVMGAQYVGKSAMITRLIRKVFVHAYDPTAQDEFRKTLSVDGAVVALNILDTAGQTEFVTLRYGWLSEKIDLLMVCFARNDRRSFQAFQEILLMAKRLLFQWKKPRRLPIVAVGTKLDETEESGLYQVSTEEIDAVLAAHGGDAVIRYAECSSLYDEGVVQVFETATRLYREWLTGKSLPEVTDGSSLELVTSVSSSIAPLEIEDKSQQRTRHKSWSVAPMTEVRRRCALPAVAGCLPHCGARKAEQSSELRVINRVPRDQFPNDISAPVFSVRNFDIKRSFSVARFVAALLVAAFFPFVLVFQTLMFVFYCEGCTLFWTWLPEWDYRDPQTAAWFDFLGPIVGRSGVFSNYKDTRQWFLNQTAMQRLARLLLCPLLCTVFGICVANAWYLIWQRDALSKYDNDNSRFELSLMEYLGPLQLWLLFWFFTAVYISTDTSVTPAVPSMMDLRPFALYFKADHSLRSTAYVFLRGFSNTTLDLRVLESSRKRVWMASITALLYALTPGLTRVYTNGVGSFLTKHQKYYAVTAFVTNMLIVFTLTLVLQMQLMSGLQTYTEWMEDVTSMLNPEVAASRGLEYLSFIRQSNALSWIEMRSFVFSKGVILQSRQEIFVTLSIFIGFGLSTYILFRAITEYSMSKTSGYGSETYNGMRLIVLILVWVLYKFLRLSQRVNELQKRQLALLYNQKMKVYYHRVTFDDQRTDSQLFANLPSLDILSNPSNSAQQSASARLLMAGTQSASSAAVGSNIQMIGSVVLTPEYLQKSEELIDNVIATVQVHKLTPKVYGIRLLRYLTFWLLALLCAVTPILVKTLSSDICEDYDYQS